MGEEVSEIGIPVINNVALQQRKAEIVTLTSNSVLATGKGEMGTVTDSLEKTSA